MSRCACAKTESGGLRCARRVLIHGPIEKVEETAGTLVVSGWANTGAINFYNDVAEPTAWTRWLGEYMNRGSWLFMHDWYSLLGRMVDLEVVPSTGLRINRALVSQETLPPQARTWLMEGFLNAFSVGFMVFDSEALPKDTEAKNPNLKIGDRILETYLDEISSVTVPADPRALMDGPARIENAFQVGTDLAPDLHERVYGRVEERRALMAAAGSILGVSRRQPLAIDGRAREAAYGRLAEVFRDLAIQPPDFRHYTLDQWEAVERKHGLDPKEQRLIAAGARRDEAPVGADRVAPDGAAQADDALESPERLLAAYQGARPKTLADYPARERVESEIVSEIRNILAGLGPA